MTHYLDRWLLISVFALSLFTHVLPAPRTIDDAFITFRYSRNLVEGQGFVYNPGVQTLGTTTPFYTLLMASISTITGGQDFPWYALSVNALADAGTATLLYLLVQRLTGSRWAGVLIGILWAISPVSVTFAVGGMETSLNIFWLVGATYLFVNDRPAAWVGVLVGLGFLTRVDSVLWIAPLLLGQLADTWLRNRGQPLLKRIPWRTWTAVVVVVLPWSLFAWSYFGSPLSNSLSAKTVAYIMPPGSAFIRLVQAYSTPFSEFTLFGSLGAMLGSILYLALSIIGLIFIARRQPRLLTFVIYPWLYMAAFSIANPLIFRWYIAPPLPALMLGILAGAWAIIEALQNARPAWRIAPVAVSLLGIVWGASSLSGWEMRPDHGPNRPAPAMAWHKIELLYEQIGTELHEQRGLTADTPVASADIGAVGYFSHARIIDTVGLVTPELSQYYPVDPSLIVEGQNYAIPPALIFATTPDYLITMEAFVRLGLEQEAKFQNDYELIEEIPFEFYGTGMRLYRSKSAATGN